MELDRDRHIPCASAPQVKDTTPLHGKAGLAEWGGLAILALPTALLGLDITLLYLALPALAADLQPSSTEALWIMDAYGFMIAGLLVPMGSLGDRIGRRRLLVLGAAAFGLASILAACSTSASMLIVARAILGVAGATLMPSTLALISNMFLDAAERALAIGIWATMFALGMAAGPLVGGMLLEQFSWSAAFLVALPVIVPVLILGPLLLPECRATATGRFDLPSVALSLGAILPVIYFVKESAKAGVSVGTLSALGIGIICAAAFIRRQRALANPLLDVRLFTAETFSSALGILLVGLTGVGGAMLLVTQYLQLVIGLSPVAAGMWMGPPALMMLVAGVTAPLLARRLRPGFVMAGALSLSSLGYALLALLPSFPGITMVVAGYSLAYLGLGTIAALGTDLVVGAAPPDKAGSASAMSEMVQELGIAVGVATLGSLAAAVYRREMSHQSLAGVPTDIAIALEESLWALSSVAAHLPQELVEQAKAAFVTGISTAAIVAAVSTAALAVLSAVMLRGVGAVTGDSRAVLCPGE